MSTGSHSISLDAAYKEIERLKAQVADLDSKLSHLRLPEGHDGTGKARQSQSAFDALTGQLPKSRCAL